MSEKLMYSNSDVDKLLADKDKQITAQNELIEKLGEALNRLEYPFEIENTSVTFCAVCGRSTGNKHTESCIVGKAIDAYKQWKDK